MATPTLNPGSHLFTVAEGTVGGAGMTVAAIIADGSIDDGSGRGGAPEAIAITAVAAGFGSWEYSLDDGASWLTLRADLLESATDELALLLGPTARLRLQPFGDLNGNLAQALTFRAWDPTTGTQGSYVVAGAGGNFSGDTGGITLSVTPVNDAPTFAPLGGGGTVLPAMSPGVEPAAILLQPDGRVLVAGETADFSNTGRVVRLLQDGTLDTSFNGTGLVELSGLNAYPRDMLLQADGAIVIVGETDGGSFALRLLADGTRDASFGTGGTATLGVAAAYVAVAVQQPDGKLVLAGHKGGTEADFFIARLDTAGALDTGFSTDGWTTLDLGSSSAAVTAIALRPDGRILVGGRIEGNGNLAVVRLLADGTPDTSFDTDGSTVVSLGSGTENLDALLLQDDGSALLVGRIGGTVKVVEIDAAGGQQALATLPGIWLNASATLLADGRLLVAGTTFGSSEQITMAVLQADGSLDTGFNGSGVLTLPGHSSWPVPQVAEQPDGSLLMTYDDGSGRLVLQRFEADGTPDATYGGTAQDTLGGTVAYTEGGVAVALDTAVTIHDPDLAALDDGAGNYQGASVTLQRQGAAVADDVFEATGSLAFTGGSAILGGVTIGTVQNAGGRLVITFNGNATQARVDEALSSLAYRNTSDAPPASVQVAWLFDDGNAGAPLTAGGTTTVTIAGTNDAPTVAAGTPVQLVEAGGTANGTAGVHEAWAALTLADVDGTAAIDGAALVADGWTEQDGGASYVLQGLYGQAVLNVATLRLDYLLDDGLAATQALKAGDSVTETFTVTVTDGEFDASADVAFTVAGANDAPVVSHGGPANILAERGGVGNGNSGLPATTVAITLGDPDGVATWDAAAMVADGWTWTAKGATFSRDFAYGTAAIDIATGILDVVLDDDAPATEALAGGQVETATFTFHVTDGLLDASSSVTVSIHGSDDAQTLCVGLQSALLEEAGGTANDLPGTSKATVVAVLADVDSTPSWSASGMAAAGWSSADGGLTWKANGLYGVATLQASTGMVRYLLGDGRAATQALAGGEVATETFRLVAEDGVATASGDAVFLVVGANDAPTLKVGAASRTVVEAGGTANALAGVPGARMVLTKADADGTVQWDTGAMLAAGWTAAGGTMSHAGAFGTATLALATGVLTYALDNAAANVLKAGQSVSESFQVQVSDGVLATQATASFTVQGADDAPTVRVGPQAGTLEEDGVGSYNTHLAQILATPQDADGTATWDTAGLAAAGWSSSDGGATWARSGRYGDATLVLATGMVDYVLDNGRAATQALRGGQGVLDSFTLAAEDGALTGQGVASFAITGADDPTVITVGTPSRNLVEGTGPGNAGSVGTARIVLGKSDVDGKAAWDTAGMLAAGWSADAGATALTRAGTFGTATLTLSTGVLAYVLDNAAVDFLQAGDLMSDPFTVLATGGGASVAAEARFTIEGANDAPRLVVGAQSAAITEAGAADGGQPGAFLIVSRSDAEGGAQWDHAALLAAGWSTANGEHYTRQGLYGTATLAATAGGISYSLDDSARATQALAAGQQVQDRFTVTATDGTLATKATVAFAITGANDAPIVLADLPSATLVEASGTANATAGVASARARVTKQDLDGTATWDVAGMLAAGWSAQAGGATLTYAGSYGRASFATATGVISYALDQAAADVLAQGQDGYDSFTVRATDGTLARAATATFTVEGANDAPRVAIAPQATAIVEAGGGIAGLAKATVLATRSDADGAASWDLAALAAGGWTSSDGGASFRLDGTHGTAVFKVATGALTYVLNNGWAATQALGAGQQATDSFTLVATDGALQGQATASFLVQGTNDTPTLVAGTQNRTLVEAGDDGAGTATARITMRMADAEGTAGWDIAALVRGGWVSADAGLSFVHAGSYGTATLATATGVLAYVLDNAAAATQALAEGQVVTDSFTLAVTDGLVSVTGVAAFQIQGADDGLPG